MKTAEEWMQDCEVRELIRHQSVQSRKNILFVFESIQTDASLSAYEKGIRDAAEKAKQVGVPMLNHTYRDYIDKCLLMREKINSEILSLLTKPKDKEC